MDHGLSTKTIFDCKLKIFFTGTIFALTITLYIQTANTLAMFSGILKQNKNLLQSTGSYLLPHLNKIILLSQKLENEAGDEYVNAFDYLALPKGTYLLAQGTVCRTVWFLKKGVARVFQCKDGTDITSYFYFPGELINAYRSSCMQVPSEVNIQLLQDSTVYSISRNKLKRLAVVYPLLSEIEKLVIECLTIWFEQEIYEIKRFDAKGYYTHLITCHPFLIRDIPVTYLASYLGVSLETLSRIRAKMLIE